MHPPDMRVDSESSKALIEQFAGLGYIQQESTDAEAVASAMRELKFNLARARMDGRNAAAAIPALEELVQEYPNELRFRQHLTQCYLITGDSKKAKQALDGMGREFPDDPRAHAIADWMMGLVLQQQGDPEMALDRLRLAEAAQVPSAALYIRLGVAYLELSRAADASRAFETALELDDENPQALVGLARVRLRERRNEEAADFALTAVGLQHYLPVGHFYLGVALMRLRDFERAIVAFETALSMAPAMVEAHRRLAFLRRRISRDSSRALEHSKAARAIRQRS